MVSVIVPGEYVIVTEKRLHNVHTRWYYYEL